MLSIGSLVNGGNPQTSNNGNNNNGDQHASSSSNAILTRLKEIEHSNQSMQGTVEKLQSELKQRDEIISQLQEDKKELSADKRKDMEQFIETAVDEWLNSLTGISENVRKRFKQGVVDLAERADVKNNAWEVVCNASRAHKENVAKIEELVRTCNEKEKTIESLLGSQNDPTFRSEASRVSGGLKRQRDDAPDNHHPAIEQTSRISTSNQKPKDAWDEFASLMCKESKDVYY
jgi:chromosome segregation ATPase